LSLLAVTTATLHLYPSFALLSTKKEKEKKEQIVLILIKEFIWSQKYR
jgi:hypothetical protein